MFFKLSPFFRRSLKSNFWRWRQSYHVSVLPVPTTNVTALLEKTQHMIHFYQPVTPRQLYLSACAYQSNDNTLEVSTYNKVSDETLEVLCETFEELIDNSDMAGDADVTLSNGVLSVNMGSSGIYVINKQSPNKQLWLSSPVSGPKRYDWINGQWIYSHNGKSLDNLLNQEISKILCKTVDFTIKLEFLKHL